MNWVKPATPADIEELVELMTEFYKESDFRLNSELARQALRKLIENPELGQAWLLQYNSEVAGYVVLTLVFSMEYGGLGAFVDDLFVRSRFRRLGLGRCGLNTLLAECYRRGVRAVYIEVDRNNKPAKELYGEFGFRDNGRQLITLRLQDETSVL